MKIQRIMKDIDIKSYKDYFRLIKGQNSKTMHDLYDMVYFEKHVGNKEMANLYFKTKGLAPTIYTQFPIELANIQPGDKVIDIGCGRGEVVFQTANLGAISTGVDYSESAIELALCTRKQHSKEIQERTEFICGNAEKLDFGENFFDKAFLLDVVEHVSQDELYAILREIKRVLKDQGILILHSAPNLWSRTYGYWLFSLISLVRGGKTIVHPVVAEFQQLKSDPNLDEMKILLHINEQSILSIKLSLHFCGFKSKVWLQKSGNQWACRKDIKGRIFSLIFDLLRLKFILGSDIYAVAYPK